MEMRFGRAGWVEVSALPLLGERLLYVRFVPDVRGRFGITELYLDGQEEATPLSGKLLRSLPLEEIEAVANFDSEELALAFGEPTVNLSALAASYATTYGSAKRDCSDWVAFSYLTQLPGFDSSSPEYEPRPPARQPDQMPAPLQRPTRVTDAFLQQVAAWYQWAIQNGKNPAPLMAAQTGSSPQSVHRWVATARKKHFLKAAAKPGQKG